MKYSLTITDMTDREAREIMAFCRSLEQGKAPDRSADVARTANESLDKMYPTNPDGSLKVTAPQPTPIPAGLVDTSKNHTAQVSQHMGAPAVEGNAAQFASSNVQDAARDAFGVPYHSSYFADRSGSTGGKNKDGSWKLKKNCDKDAAAAYRAQFIQGNHAPAASGNGVNVPAAPAPVPSPVAAPHVPQPTAEELNAKFAPGIPPQGATVPAPQPTPMPAPQPMPAAMAFGGPAPTPVVTEVTYEMLSRRVGEMLQGGKLTGEQLNAIHTECQADPQGLAYADDPTTGTSQGARRLRAWQLLDAIPHPAAMAA